MDETVIFEQARAIASLLVVLARQVFAVDNDAAAELPVAQLRVCGMLYRAPRSMSALGRESGVSLSAMTQIADRLERAGLVKRAAEGTDRRVKCLQLTPRGEEIMRQHETARVERVLALLEHLPAQAREEAVTALQTMARACLAMQSETLAVEVAGQ